MSFFVALSEDGSYYSLTGAGTALVIILMIVLVLTVSFVSGRDGKKFSTKQLVFSAMSLALAFVLSFVKIFELPWGGAATLCSMFFVTLIGAWYGPRIGITAGFAYGLLQFIQGGGGYILDPVQVCLDYIVAFAALGVSGFFCKSKNGLLKGYIVGILLRGAFHAIGGYIYWMGYMPENFPKNLAAVYPIVYNYSYILIEGVITVAVMLLPPVKSALQRVSIQAAE
ncbi:MAG: energy-coupled thiamine transporter ThiT [Lachnospiraceae bacterium]|nr:energy-coupled thiamine transporter ThiT [Lachnospiraceae bacterium]